MPIPLDGIMQNGVITLESKNPKSDLQLQFGVTVSQAPAPFDKTKVLTIVPRYMVVNKLNRPIVLQQSKEQWEAVGEDD